jgi:hypothetical protein
VVGNMRQPRGPEFGESFRSCHRSLLSWSRRGQIITVRNSEPWKRPENRGIPAHFAILCPLPRECQGYVTHHPRRRKGLGKRNRSGAISDDERQTRFASIRPLGGEISAKNRRSGRRVRVSESGA